MSASPLHATTSRLDAATGCALGEMPVQPRAASTLFHVSNRVVGRCAVDNPVVGNLTVVAKRNVWVTRGTACAHATAKPATKAGYDNPIGDGIRVSRGTG